MQTMKLPLGGSLVGSNVRVMVTDKHSQLGILRIFKKISTAMCKSCFNLFEMS